MLNRDNQIFAFGDNVRPLLAWLVAFFLGTEVPIEPEAKSWLRAAMIATCLEILAQVVAFLHAALCQRFSVIDILVAIGARIFIQFMGKYVSLAIQRVAAGKMWSRVFIIKTGQGQLSGAESSHGLPLFQTIIFLRP
ncbi:hypothetical protein D3C81_391470 [compost metagenome]